MMAFIMLLYFITMIIFCCISYKKLKKDIFNIPRILNNKKSIEFQPMIKEKKNPIKKKNKINKKTKATKKIKFSIQNNINIYSINEKNSLKKILKK